MEVASHTGFIVAAYAAAGAVLGGLIAWVMLDYSAQLRNLAELERRGVRGHAASATAAAAAPQASEGA
jgi:heme exporter protein CcmD